jgi:NADPH:quinone reductase-like Zn-dependent oxidoreductase
MKAVVYDAPRQFSVREVPTPDVKAGDVRVRVEKTGSAVPTFIYTKASFSPSSRSYRAMSSSGRSIPSATGLTVSGWASTSRSTPTSIAAAASTVALAGLCYV